MNEMSMNLVASFDMFPKTLLLFFFLKKKREDERAVTFE